MLEIFPSRIYMFPFTQIKTGDICIIKDHLLLHQNYQLEILLLKCKIFISREHVLRYRYRNTFYKSRTTGFTQFLITPLPEVIVFSYQTHEQHSMSEHPSFVSLQIQYLEVSNAKAETMCCLSNESRSICKLLSVDHSKQRIISNW